PQLETKRGITHNRKTFRKTNAGFSSNNWSGGSLKGNWVTAIGTWVVPTVSKPSEGQGLEGGWNSSSWVGIDGANGSNDVLQGGVQQRVDANGNASYVAWFEWFAPIQKTILSDTSPLTPALASLNGNSSECARFCTRQQVQGHDAVALADLVAIGSAVGRV